MKKGLLIVLSGPSGVGKKTIWQPLLADEQLGLVFSISMTTRNKRFDETEAKDYFFVSKKEFQEAIKNNELLEYAMYVNNYYGTPRKYVDDLRMQGFNVLLEIESKGALQIMDYAKKNKDKGIITIFISPPNFDELIKRLKTRGTEDAIKIKERIKQAKWEVTLVDKYDYNIVNSDVNKARDQFKKILLKEIKKC